ncbi:4-hydroxy-tetrahydrodipicolinate synthase [Iodobacter sp. HSC-16F04]|uniref:4-hydroxy-tetrahydrodipicolinate synthase n=1 Tax=Iodobacter violaceini TaxID=3044271 RepID=A0ABX0L048_9NEIS|nr:4-hydroxy-tetrahydrodipicolinate synthase [Iodobacter violacea]NHQ87852.1 4-hydroxy-tetrahydrodipicolinate synthase [Iodobacter violacea]
MTGFSGIWVPMVTPFFNGQVDLAAASRLAKHLEEQGADGLIVCGTTGESATLSQTEQHQLLAAVIQAVSKNYPVAFGISGNNTAEVIEAAAALNDIPIAALLVSAPYYVRPSQSGILQHFEAIAAASRHPVIIYNIPYRTGVAIELATIKALSLNPQFAAIKESGGGQIEAIYQIINETPLKFLSGEDHLIFITSCMGGHGAIAAAAHIRPDLYKKMLRYIQEGNLAAARIIDLQLRPLIKLLFSEPNPAVIKAALAMQGLIHDELRLPMTPASAETKSKLSTLLAEISAI